jgi:hypothetical protein
VTVLTLLAFLGTDFLLNGALFAGLYQRSSPFLLAPAELARRIPVGYLAFLIVALAVVELTYRLKISGWWRGAQLGAIAGAAVGAVWSLSLYSIATIDVQTALAFFIFWVVMVAVGGAVAGFGLGARSLRGLAFRVITLDIACAAVVIALQSAGLVPTTRV